ncbi:hypothetical protein ACVI1J_009863 [Bradyrhizobium diazoefficiens]|uniref:hypothetical protein n=1 Tax=Bradyrhizobium TaxID=374 RepID=UPI0013A539BE|nr:MULTISPECIES: hypothetical protein [Bradyrhizobium]AWO92071.2 hypothetical protein DI395_28630 [Bradyrhizobium diazoefficiens]WLA68614.1 hypothetical protein QNN01_19315 [Bradyrhizobium diazoefficiens]
MLTRSMRTARMNSALNWVRALLLICEVMMVPDASSDAADTGQGGRSTAVLEICDFARFRAKRLNSRYRRRPETIPRETVVVALTARFLVNLFWTGAAEIFVKPVRID